MNNTTLTIHGQRMADKELRQFSEFKLLDKNTPSWEKDIFRFILIWLNNLDFIIQYSSGTTGRSKKLRLPKTSMIRSAEHTCRYFNLTRDQTAVLCLPMDYIAGKMMVVRCMVAGLDLRIVEPTGKPDFSGITDADFCAMVPLQVVNLLKDPGNLPAIKKILIGGAEITSGLVNQVSSLPAEVYASFGTAETCSHIALRRLNGSDRQDEYHALPEVYLEQDDRGCLVITADYLPQKIVTNDLVQLTGPGSFLWTGRFDNLINSGGIKVMPEEIESRILKETGLECAIIGLPDMKLGQRLVAVAEINKITTREHDLMSSLRKSLPARLRINNIILVKRFPRNSALKLDRKKLAGMVNPQL